MQRYFFYDNKLHEWHKMITFAFEIVNIVNDEANNND